MHYEPGGKLLRIEAPSSRSRHAHFSFRVRVLNTGIEGRLMGDTGA